jgi:hypothetical protein
MSSARAFAWWYWFMIFAFLGGSLAGYRTGLPVAIGVASIRLAHFVRREKRLQALTVQVRLLRAPEIEPRLREMMPACYAAAWDLCRRGILRPGIREYGAQSTDDGASGNGYTVTPFGEQWLAESNRDDFVPTEPERFAHMFAPYQPRFGVSFQERAQEAIRCYGAHASLA